MLISSCRVDNSINLLAQIFSFFFWFTVACSATLEEVKWVLSCLQGGGVEVIELPWFELIDSGFMCVPVWPVWCVCWTLAFLTVSVSFVALATSPFFCRYSMTAFVTSSAIWPGVVMVSAVCPGVGIGVEELCRPFWSSFAVSCWCFLAHRIQISEILPWVRKSYLTQAIFPRLSCEGYIHWLYWNARTLSSSDVIVILKWCHHVKLFLSVFRDFWKLFSFLSSNFRSLWDVGKKGEYKNLSWVWG